MAIKIDRELKDRWEKILKDSGLGPDAGRDPGHRKLVYVGSGTDVTIVDEILRRNSSGRVRPKGAGPDDDREADNR